MHDLVAVLLRRDPSRRPSAAQILSLENLKPHIEDYISYYERVQFETSKQTSQQHCQRQVGNRVTTASQGESVRTQQSVPASTIEEKCQSVSWQKIRKREGVSDTTNTAQNKPSAKHSVKKFMCDKEKPYLSQKVSQGERKMRLSEDNKENVCRKV